MALGIAKVSEEIVAINEAAFFYPSDLVNTKTTIPSGSVKSGGYIPRRFASRYISTTPSGDSCIIFDLLFLDISLAPLYLLT